jgi:hypothetical protein
LARRFLHPLPVGFSCNCLVEVYTHRRSRPLAELRDLSPQAKLCFSGGCTGTAGATERLPAPLARGKHSGGSARTPPAQDLASKVRFAGVHLARPRIWANFSPLLGISSQTAGPTCEFWANPVHFRFRLLQRRRSSRAARRTRRAAIAQLLGIGSPRLPLLRARSDVSLAYVSTPPP